MKRPVLDIPVLNSIQKASAYVNYRTQVQATKAISSLNEKIIIPGMPAIRVQFYSRQNKFPGLYRGLDR